MRPIIILMVFFCSGCAKVQYLDEALRLKAYSDEKTAQNAYVQAQDARFEKMLQQSRGVDAFRAYRDKRSFVRAFGDPLFCRPAGDLEQCLYRRSVQSSNGPKIYLYFNARGEFVRWHGGAS